MRGSFYYSSIGENRLGDTTLGVYETNPTESLLELFWETSTAGLIKQDTYILTSNQYEGLNDLIDSNVGSPGPVNLSQINFVLNEADVSGTDALSLEFELLDGGNNPCNDPLNNVTILSVKDGSSIASERKSEFNINNTNIPADQTKWMITSNNTFVYNSDANTRENYTFYLECTANGITNTISFNGALSNTDPVNISFPNYVRANPPFSSTTSFQFENSLAPQDVTILAIGEIENGSINSTRNTEQLTYGVSVDPSNGYNNNFTNYTDTNGNVILSYDGGISISGTPSSVTIPATLTVNDANGNGGNIQIPFQILVLG